MSRAMSRVWRRVLAEGAAETAAVALGVAGLGMLVTARERAGHPSPEHGVNRWLAEHRTRPLDTVTWALSTYADTGPTIVAALAYGANLGRRAPREEVVSRAVAPLTAITLETIAFTSAAVIVGRERPAVPQLDLPAPTSSFPSGHTGANVALHVTVANLALPPDARVRRALLTTALPAAVAASRVYRGMHHPSDVLVGAAVGAWAARRVRLAEAALTAWSR